MDEVTLADAQRRLGELIDRVEAGESISITRGGKTVARLSGVHKRRPIDIAALKTLTDSMSCSTQSAADLVRSMRDGERY